MTPSPHTPKSPSSLQPLSRLTLTLTLLLLSPLLTPPLHAQTLTRLHYNHPHLSVDLGVGLWAWPIPCDPDHDGDFDLLVSCPDKPSNGVYFFENVSGTTTTQPLPIFKPGRKISPTIHNVTPSYVNGHLHVLSPGLEYPSFTTIGTTTSKSLPIPPRFYKPQGTQNKGPGLRHNQWRYTDFNGDGTTDLVFGLEDWSFYGWDNAHDSKGHWTNGPLRGFVYLALGIPSSNGSYSNPTPITLSNGSPLETFGCPSPNFEDFDHDGDLDLLCGEFLDSFTYFENVGSRIKPAYAPGRKVRDQQGNILKMDLQMIVPVAFDWDRDGDMDLIVGDEDGRVAWIQNLGTLSHHTPVFAKPVYFQQEADTLKCGALATPVGVDWDNDGDTDIVSGNTAGYLEWFENLSGAGIAQPQWASPRKIEVNGRPFRIQAGPKGSIQGPAEAKWGYTTLNVADWDMDGRLDVIFNSIWGRVQWLRNIGTRAKPQFSTPQSIQVRWNDSSPTPKPAWTWWKPKRNELVTQWRTPPVVHDFNQDGWPDLAMLDQEGYLSYFERRPRSLQLNHPRHAFLDESGHALRLNTKSAGGSGRRKLCVTDWNGDGKFDFLLNSANADLLQQTGTHKNTWFFSNAGSLAHQNIEGHDVSPATVDFNGDQIPDFLGGAEDGRFYFMQNPRSR